jgi:hypothetical protein
MRARKPTDVLFPVPKLGFQEDNAFDALLPAIIGDGWVCKSCGTYHEPRTLRCLNRKCRSSQSDAGSKHG